MAVTLRYTNPTFWEKDELDLFCYDDFKEPFLCSQLGAGQTAKVVVCNLSEKTLTVQELNRGKWLI